MAMKTNVCLFVAAWLLLLLTGVQCQVPGVASIQGFPVVAPFEVQITIGDPSDPGGSAVNDFSIQYREVGSTSDDDWVLFRTRDGAGGTWVIDSLEASTTYEFRVAAINDDGRGDWTPLSEVTTLDAPTTTGPTTTTTTGASTTRSADGASNDQQSGGDGTAGNGATEGGTTRGTTQQDQSASDTSSTPVAAIAAPIAVIALIALLVVGYLLLRRSSLKSSTRWGKKGRGIQPESKMEKGEEKAKLKEDETNDKETNNDTPGPEESNGQSSLKPPHKGHVRAFSAA